MAILKLKRAANCNAIAIALSSLIMIFPWAGSNALAQEDTASRIQAKISQVGASATKLHDAGGDVSSIQQAMQQVDRLLKSGRPGDAEKILDTLVGTPGVPDAGPVRAPVAVSDVANCDSRRPMVVSGRTTVKEDCTVGGDLTVTGSGILQFDYSGQAAGRVVVGGNVVVQDHATLWIQGRRDKPAVFVVDNGFNQQRSITSMDDASIKLSHVEFRTQKSADRGKGSVSMTYEARNRSSFEVTGSTIVEEESWLLANLHDSAHLSVSDTQHVPNEIYVRDSSSVKISGAGTQAGVWLDAGDAKGTLKLPDMRGPFSWRIGAGLGLDVGWSLQVDNALPGIGIEVKPTSALTIIGNGTQATTTGELKISYFVVGSRETLDGLKAGLQNRKISDRLTLKDVQLGPIAWQIYAGDNADLTIRASVINEIGIFGRDSKVSVEHSVLQLGVLAVLMPGSSLDIRDSDVWNQAIEVANKARVSIADSKIHGSLFHTRDKGSTIFIKGGSFGENPARCTQAMMVDIVSGRPNCNPFRTPGLPHSMGAGKVECVGTERCTWGGQF